MLLIVKAVKMTVYKMEDNRLVTRFNKLIASIDGNKVLNRQGNTVAYVEDYKIYNSNDEILAAIKGNEIYDSGNNMIGSIEDARKLIDDSAIDMCMLAAVWTIFFLG